MPWASTAISVGGSLLGGLFGGKGKKRAAQEAARVAAAQEARIAALQAQNRLDTKPYREAGEGAQNMLSDLLGTKANAGTGSGSLLKPFSNEDFVKDPGYLARLLEGEQGEQRNLIARGASDSGQALKELERYRQTYASNEFGNAYSRDAANKARTYDFLSGQTSQGLNAINGGASLGTNLSGLSAQNSQNNSANMLNQANLRDENRGNSFQSAISNLIYGMNRNSGRTPPYIPETGGYSTPPAGSFAKLFL